MGARAEEFGPYLVYEQLGIGGMASVHRAEAHGIEGFSRPVALKRMLPHVADDATLVQSFVREARLASHLRHENVAQTYELGKVGDIYFIAMELVIGRNVRELLKHCLKVTGPMPVPIALNILNQLCDALDYAHNLCDETGSPLKIIHRDVSPSNLIVSEGSGVLKLIDFGIAKASGSGMQTMSGIVKGKFGYMAPEYIAGRLDARADLFAVGVIAHELLSNRPLFQGRDDMDTLLRVKDMPIDPPSYKNPNVPREVDEIVMTALERDPDRRWQHATALRTAMTTVTKRLGLVAMNTQVVEWIDWAFKQRKEDSDPDISISQGTQQHAMPPAASGPMTKLERPISEPMLAEASGSITAPRSSQPHRAQRPSHPQPTHRPSQPHPAQRVSQPQPIQRPSQPQPVQRRSAEVASAASSGSITTPAIGITAAEVTRAAAEMSIEMRQSAREIDAPVRAGSGTTRRGRGLILAVLLVVAAAGATAVVYFALPYFS